MKRTLSYVFMSVLFFNVLFSFYYYFKIVSFWYLDLFGVNKPFNFIFINIMIIVVDVIYILLYKYLLSDKFSYFKIVLVGVLIGIVFSAFLLKTFIFALENYLSVVSYFVINTIFISYSLFFEKEKINVFE